MTGVSGGNPDLGPEEAATSTLGVVWTSPLSSPLLNNLQVSLDWYEIDITDKIEIVNFSDFGQFCYDRRYNADLSATNQWCTMFSRNPVSGRVNDFEALNQNALRLEDERYRRAGRLAVRPGPGQLGVSWLVSWLDSFTTDGGRQRRGGGPSGPGRSERTSAVSRLPEWKSNLHVSYAWGDLTVGAGWRYIDSMLDANKNLDSRVQDSGDQLFRPGCELRVLVRIPARAARSVSGSKI